VLTKHKPKFQTEQDLVNEKKFINELSKTWQGLICKAGEFDHFDYTLRNENYELAYILELRSRRKTMDWLAKNDYMVSAYKIKCVVEAAQIRNARPLFGVLALDGQFVIDLLVKPDRQSLMQVPDRDPLQHDVVIRSNQLMNFYVADKFLPMDWLKQTA